MARSALFQWALRIAHRAVYGSAPSGGPASLDDVRLVRLDGKPLDASVLRGRVLLVVNVASKCRLAPQYEELVALQRSHFDRGLTVLGVPCNQFFGQEPGTAAEIESHCRLTYGVDFPLLEKQDVNGARRSPLYRFLLDGARGGRHDIEWNFEKFLVGRDGTVRARFGPALTPGSPEVMAQVEAALG